MQVSDWWMFLSFYQNVLAVPLGIVLLVLLARARTARRRALYASLLVLAFVPHIQLYAGNYYFDYLCRTQAGEFIYRTVDNVEAILQMRPRDGSKDYFDRMRAGDIPEDPWGHTNWEAQKAHTLFVNPPWANYKFFETQMPGNGHAFPGERLQAKLRNSEPDARFRRFYGYHQAKNQPMYFDLVSRPRSLYGYRWFGTASPVQQFFNIRRGAIEVLRIGDEEVLGRLVGFYRARPAQTCPAGRDDDFVYKFVSKVVKPPSLKESK